MFVLAEAHLVRFLDLLKKLDVYRGIILDVLGYNNFGIGGHLGAWYFFTRWLGEKYIEFGPWIEYRSLSEQIIRVEPIFQRISVGRSFPDEIYNTSGVVVRVLCVVHG